MFCIAGLGYGLLLGKTFAGPLLDFLMYFDVQVSPQVCPFTYFYIFKTHLYAILTTVSQSSHTLVWELAARVITTALLFGVF